MTPSRTGGPAKIDYLIAGPEKASSGDFAFARFEIDLLVRTGAAAGLAVRPVDWRAPDAGAEADLVVVGPCWDYQDDADAFLSRLDTIAARTPLENPPALLRWNARKTYLQNLAEAGVPVVPTRWGDRAGPHDLARAFDEWACDKIVVKPQVGAGALGLFRVDRAGADAVDPAHPTLRRAHMVQPFLPAVTAEGEISMIFFGGAFSHALVKRPKAGDFRSQGEYGARETRLDPSPGDRTVAERAIAAAPAAAKPLYARVDMVRGADGGLMVMELELIEPQLYFNVATDAVEAFVRAIRARLAER